MPTTPQLLQLQKATKEYVAKERTRLTNEASVLEAILKGRTGGKGLQTLSIQTMSAVAQKDIEVYLTGK